MINKQLRQFSRSVALLLYLGLFYPGLLVVGALPFGGGANNGFIPGPSLAFAETEPQAESQIESSAEPLGPAASSSTTKALLAPTVRKITIEIREIFDEPNLGGFYRGVNKLKINTREEIVRRELLINEGDVFDPFLLAESERNLRSLQFLRQVSITPIVDGQYVDLIVSVQDTWTLYPFLNLSSGGGTSSTTIGLNESNVLGYGKRFEMLYEDDEGRDKVEGVWDDRRFMGTNNRLTLGHFQRSDGPNSVISFGRPFRSLVDPYAWSVNSDYFDLVGKLFENGQESYIYRQDHIGLAGGYTFSRGDPQVLLRRYTFGYGYLRDKFKQADADDYNDVNVDPDSVSMDPALLADDREFSGPFFTYQQIYPDFLSINFIDRFERIQDFNLGNVLNFKTQVAPDVLGSLEDTLLFDINDSDGWRFGPTTFLRGEVQSTFRVNDSGIDDFIGSIRLKYYDVLGAQYWGGFYVGKHTLASHFLLDVGADLDKDTQFLLGADTGLRGYEDRTFTGDNRLLVNLEDRFHIVEDVYRLVSIGGVIFADAGGTSDKNAIDIFYDNVYADVGVGFRFGFTRSSGGAVLRIDLAYPLRDGPDGSRELELRALFTSGQAFSSGLRSESLNDQRTSVSAGFLP